MPFAFTHIIFPMVIADLIRHHLLKTHHIKRWQFSTKWIFFAGLAGLLPDLDVPIKYFSGMFFGKQWAIHGGFSHQLYVPIIAVLAAGIIYTTQRKIWRWNYKQVSLFLVILAGGFLSHTFLDCAVEGGYPLMPPFVSNDMCTRIVPKIYLIDFLAGLDAVLLVLWLFYEERRHKIRDVI